MTGEMAGKVAVAAALVFGYPAAVQGNDANQYYVQNTVIACEKMASLRSLDGLPESISAQEFEKHKCFPLQVNDRVTWNGERIYQWAVIAHIQTADGRDAYTFANFLGAQEHRDTFQKEFLTSEIAILCARPDDLREADTAVRDANWMKQLGCVVAEAGLPVTKIEPLYLSDPGPWKVRVSFRDGQGITLWGEKYAFTFPDGARVPIR